MAARFEHCRSKQAEAEHQSIEHERTQKPGHAWRRLIGWPPMRAVSDPFLSNTASRSSHLLTRHARIKLLDFHTNRIASLRQSEP